MLVSTHGKPAPTLAGPVALIVCRGGGVSHPSRSPPAAALIQTHLETQITCDLPEVRRSEISGGRNAHVGAVRRQLLTVILTGTALLKFQTGNGFAGIRPSLAPSFLQWTDVAVPPETTGAVASPDKQLHKAERSGTKR